MRVLLLLQCLLMMMLTSRLFSIGRSSFSLVGTHRGQKSPESITTRRDSLSKRAVATELELTHSSSIDITGGAVFQTVTFSFSSRSSQCSGSDSL